MKRYIKTFESFREDMRNATKLNEAEETKKTEKDLKPTLSPLVYLLSAIPFGSYKELKEFLLTLKGSDFKKLYGEKKNPAHLLSDMLSWSGTGARSVRLIYPDKPTNAIVGDKGYGMLTTNQHPFIPFQVSLEETIEDNEMVKDFAINVTKPKLLGDSMGYDLKRDIIDGSNEIQLVKFEEYLNQKQNDVFNKNGEETYKAVVADLASKKPNVKELEKEGFRLNSFEDLAKSLNELSEAPKAQLAKTGIIDTASEKVTYSEEAKKAVNKRLSSPIVDATANTPKNQNA